MPEPQQKLAAVAPQYTHDRLRGAPCDELGSLCGIASTHDSAAALFISSSCLAPGTPRREDPSPPPARTYPGLDPSKPMTCMTDDGWRWSTDTQREQHGGVLEAATAPASCSLLIAHMRVQLSRAPRLGASVAVSLQRRRSAPSLDSAVISERAGRCNAGPTAKAGVTDSQWRLLRSARKARQIMTPALCSSGGGRPHVSSCTACPAIQTEEPMLRIGRHSQLTE